MIDEASIKDIPLLCDLLAKLFTQESDFKPNAVKQAMGLRLIIENSQYGKIFVMRSEMSILGMINLLTISSVCHGSHTLLLEDMIVRRESRCKGIATALLQHAIEYARSRGVSQITLLTDATNNRAIRLYQKQGFINTRAAPMRWTL